MQLSVKTIACDEELAIVKKEISIPGRKIHTPYKTLRPTSAATFTAPEAICEISRKINAVTLEQMHKGLDFGSEFSRTLKKKKGTGMSLVHFNLNVNVLPDEDHAKTLANSLYSVSDGIICLPSVKASVFKSTEPGRKIPKITLENVDRFIKFQGQVIEALKIKNKKAILGNIPLFLPPIATNKIIDFYFKQDITHFVIDANTSDVLNHESDIRSILGRITYNAKERKETLDDTYLHAINLGINQFEMHEIPADDMLSLFAYIDSFGICFKTRGGSNVPGKPSAPPRKKFFSRAHYLYHILNQATEPTLKSMMALSSLQLQAQNEKNLYQEALYLKDKIGQEKMAKYVKQKKGVSEITYRKLQNIHDSIKR